MILFPAADLVGSGAFFRVLHTSAKSQIATMTLHEGQESGPFGTDHAQADQFLYVVSGRVDAQVAGESARLEAGSAILVPAGEDHRFVGASEEPAVTLNVYAPVAYPDEA